jgi:DNA-binding NarL/FixJ family response regulator
MNPIRVMIVDDHEIVREGLQILLAEEAEFEVVGTAADGIAALALVGQLKPDVVLMDVAMPDMNGIEVTKRILAGTPNARVLILTTFAEDQSVRAAIQAGAIGYLLKDVLKADLLRALRDTASGRASLHPEAQKHLMHQVIEIGSPPPHTNLTKREADILRLLAKGRSNKEIALALSLTEGTVKGYASMIFDKLGVEDRTQAALYAVKHGLA